MRQEAQRQEEGLIAAAGAYCSSFKNETINQLSLNRQCPPCRACSRKPSSCCGGKRGSVQVPVPSPIAAHSKCLKMPRVVAPLSPACCLPQPPPPPSAAFPCLSNAVSKTCTADCQPSSLYLHPPPQALPPQYRSSAAVCSTQQQSLPQVPSCSPNTSATAQRCPPNKLLRSVPTRDVLCYSHQRIRSAAVLGQVGRRPLRTGPFDHRVQDGGEDGLCTGCC
jgi:hypothetical protein